MSSIPVTVTVRPGDTLYGIAQAALGDGYKWPTVYAENRAVIGSDPNLIYVGEQLTIGGTSYTGRHRAVTGEDDSVPAGPSSPSSIMPATAAPGSTASVSVTPGDLVSYARFFVQHGYSRAAAAGIAGDIYGESGGNPESVGSGGGGLIGWTPLSSAAPNPNIVTGNPAQDAAVQLGDILTYNQVWAQFLPQLNAAPDPVTAGDIYSQDFERPAVLFSDTRPSVAQQIYNQL